eukprot:Lankesteria_metandrocarpae@DN4742_c0_g2_i2.p1
MILPQAAHSAVAAAQHQQHQLQQQAEAAFAAAGGLIGGHQQTNGAASTPTASLDAESLLAAANVGTSPIGSGVAAGGGLKAPSVEIKLFVSRVAKTYDEESLRPIFAAFGTVLEVAIIREKGSNTHRGCAFVRMASLTEGDTAIRAMDLDTAPGAMLVRYAEGEVERLGLSPNAQPGKEQAKLFVGSLPRGVPEDDVLSVFSPFGRIDEIFLLKDNMTGLCKGCAPEYECHYGS